MKASLLTVLADEKYIDQAKQLFSGAYFKAGWQGDCMLLSHHVSSKDLEWFSDRGIMIKKCEDIFTDEELGELYESSSKMRPQEFSAVVLNKIYLFTPEFRKWKNVVYLDLDILIGASLDELAVVSGFWAVKDMANQLKRQFLKRNEERWRELAERYPLDEKSFNSGVMAFSTDVIKDNTAYELKELFKRYNPIRKTFDQSFLNLYFCRQWKPLNVSYNTFRPYIRLNNHLAKKALTHFAGPASQKPWDYDSPYYLEWKQMFDRADSLDFKQCPAPGKKLAKWELWWNATYLEIEIQRRKIGARVGTVLHQRLRMSPRLFNFASQSIRFLDRLIELAGIVLKKISPGFYFYLVRLKRKKF